MEDFWRWLHSEQFMQSVTKAAGQSYLVLHRDRVLVLGESAGPTPDLSTAAFLLQDRTDSM